MTAGAFTVCSRSSAKFFFHSRMRNGRNRVDETDRWIKSRKKTIFSLPLLIRALCLPRRFQRYRRLLRNTGGGQVTVKLGRRRRRAALAAAQRNPLPRTSHGRNRTGLRYSSRRLRFFPCARPDVTVHRIVGDLIYSFTGVSQFL